jgi:hypothetical protein
MEVMAPDVTLTQRQRFLKRKYTLAPDGIHASERSLLSGRSLVVPYEVMLGTREEVLVSSKRSFWIMVVLAVIAAVTALVRDAERLAPVFWGALAAVAGASFLASRRDQISFSDGEHRLNFLRNRPSERELDDFLAAALAEARQRVRRRVLPLARSHDIRHDRERAAWLRAKGIISADELDAFERSLAEGSEPSATPEPSLN